MSLIITSLRRLRTLRRRYVVLAVFLLTLFTTHFVDFRELGEEWPFHLARPYFHTEPVPPQEPAGQWDDHPVVFLHKEALDKFAALTARQSQTPDAAEAEYTRRYRKAPPPGFARWVEHALAKGSPIIDDFDVLTRPVHRFAHLSALEIKQRVRRADEGNAKFDRIKLCKFGGEPGRRKFDEGCKKWAEPLTNLLGDARDLAPDVEFLVNFLDEPSVLVVEDAPPKDSDPAWVMLSNHSISSIVERACRLRESPNPLPGSSLSSISASSSSSISSPSSLGASSTPSLSSPSPTTSPLSPSTNNTPHISNTTASFSNTTSSLSNSSLPLQRREPSAETYNDYNLPFVRDPADQKDLCRHAEYSDMHGFVMCPTTLRQMPTLTPVLSQAAPDPFSDILLPAPHYSMSRNLYKPWQDRAWEAKKSMVYWAGSNTGGRWTLQTWARGLRQRLVSLAQGKERRGYTHLGHSPFSSVAGMPQPLSPHTVSSTAPEHISLFDVSMTRILADACATPAACEAQRAFFGGGGGLPPSGRPERMHAKSRPTRYRLQLDVDGNSYSGRFYRMLASRSCPLKATVFREWHDDRLVPWLHYVPVSQSLEELPELVRFLAGTRRGSDVARAIADAGREWHDRAVAPVHQGLYLYRLMLELAWLMDESRPVT
ncbi:hypothetical protein RB595_001919 [Gaeumannomyces hyphopodioides]